MSFSPKLPHDLAKLPPKQVVNNDYWQELLPASNLIAELKGLTLTLPNPLLLISPTVTRESVASSEIENIHTTVEGVFQSQLFPPRNQKLEDKEVLRYRDALLWAFNHKNIPISTRLVLGIHEKLIIPGGGQYRKLQNKIEDTAKNITLYTPPIASHISELMNNWERFSNNEGYDLHPLIRCAVLHYQFEAIHPFSDGNGRTGRILMVIQLVRDKLLLLPVLFISGYLDRHRSEYYKLLRNVTELGEWQPYIKFMLKAFAEQASETRHLLLSISGLRRNVKRKLKKDFSKIYSTELLDALFSFPVISPSKLADIMSIHYTTASAYLNKLKKGGILKDSWDGKYHLYYNMGLINVIKKRHPVQSRSND